MTTLLKSLEEINSLLEQGTRAGEADIIRRIQQRTERAGLRSTIEKIVEHALKTKDIPSATPQGVPIIITQHVLSDTTFFQVIDAMEPRFKSAGIKLEVTEKVKGKLVHIRRDRLVNYLRYSVLERLSPDGDWVWSNGEKCNPVSPRRAKIS